MNAISTAELAKWTVPNDTLDSENMEIMNSFYFNSPTALSPQTQTQTPSRISASLAESFEAAACVNSLCWRLRKYHNEPEK